MDDLKLAQLTQLLRHDVSENMKLEIMKNIDVTCTISGKSSAIKDKLPYLGYNCLHMAVMGSNLDLTQKLLNLGANLLQQGVQDGKTPLRKAIDEKYYGRSLLEIIGVLQERPLVNTLLSAQVKSNNVLNAKCNDGISHLHIACMINHTEAVHFFAKSGESLNQAINANAKMLPGYTPLHCAIRYASSEAAIILLALGADIYLENAEGINSIDYLIERLLEVYDYLTLGTSCYGTCYEREIERLDTILKAIVLKYKLNDSTLIENTGLSALHLACTLKCNWIAHSIICDLNDINRPATCKSKVWSGWTPLHFAMCCNIQTCRLLLQRGANINIKNTRGKTALDFCLQRYSPEVALSYLDLSNDMSIMLSDKSTKLSDLILVLNEEITCKKFIEKLTDINISLPFKSPFWPGYNLLHMSVSMNHKVKVAEVFRDKIDPDYRRGNYHHPLSSWIPETKSIYWPRFEMILKKHCSIYAKNADGLTPIHLAFKLNGWHALEELLARVQQNVVGPGNLSFLHMACQMGKKDVVQRLLQKGADVNSPLTSSFEFFEKPRTLADVCNLRKVLIRRNSTPLHIAVIFEMEEVVINLLKEKPDVHAQDELGLTPIHLSFSSTKTIAQLLVSANVSHLKEMKRDNGLSYLHVATFADNEKAVKKLIQDGADINQTYLGNTPLHLAMGGEKAARLLINMGADVFAENRNHETPLDLAMKHSYCEISKFLFQKLKKSELKTSTTVRSGLKTLHIACATFDLDWTKDLLKSGANPNAKMTNSDDQINTPLHLVIAKAVTARPVTEKLVKFIKLLLEYEADVTVLNEDSTTPLHMIANAYLEQFRNDELRSDRAILLTVANLMLSSQRSFKINPANTDGFSHFHFACIIDNLAIIKKYLDSGVDVNHYASPFATEYAGFTPLHFACEYVNLKTIRLLLQQGADVKTVDTKGNTPLHILAQKSFLHEQLFDTFLMKGADINAKNLQNETPFTSFLHRNNVTNEQICFFIERGSLIEQEIKDGQGMIGYIIKRTKPSDIELVFETIINFCNIKKAISEGFLAIHNIVCVDGSKNLTREFYMKAAQRLIDIGSDLEEQNDKGKTPLEKALNFRNLGAFEALLRLGANINFIYIGEYYYGREVDTIIMNHLWKMTLVELDLTVSKQEAAKSENLDENMVQHFHLELEKLKKQRICQSVTARHFLSEWRAVIDYPTLSIVERQAIDNFFKQTDNLHKEFPEFAGLLMMQYRKAVARVKLMQPAKNILVEAGIDLPDLCLEAILKYFKNCELEFWIKEAEEMPRPLKRRRIQ